MILYICLKNSIKVTFTIKLKFTEHNFVKTHQIFKTVSFLGDILCQAYQVCQVLVGRHLLPHGFFHLLSEAIDFLLVLPAEVPNGGK